MNEDLPIAESGEWLGSNSVETVAEAVDWATEIVREWECRIRLRVKGRGLVGQLMWEASAR